MKKYWFKAKKYGYGWQPASWEGWAVLLGFVILVLLNTLRLNASGDADPKTFTFVFLQNAALIILLLVICYRTGEKPRWQWGGKKKWKSANDELNRDV